MTLYEGLVNKKYVVESVEVTKKTKKRLQDMGITPGVAIKVMSKLGTHAYILKIRGSRVGLGSDILKKINITDFSCDTCQQRKG